MWQILGRLLLRGPDWWRFYQLGSSESAWRGGSRLAQDRTLTLSSLNLRVVICETGGRALSCKRMSTLLLPVSSQQGTAVMVRPGSRNFYWITRTACHHIATIAFSWSDLGMTWRMLVDINPLSLSSSVILQAHISPQMMTRSNKGSFWFRIKQKEQISKRDRFWRSWGTHFSSFFAFPRFSDHP